MDRNLLKKEEEREMFKGVYQRKKEYVNEQFGRKMNKDVVD